MLATHQTAGTLLPWAGCWAGPGTCCCHTRRHTRHHTRWHTRRHARLRPASTCGDQNKSSVLISVISIKTRLLLQQYTIELDQCNSR